MSRECWVTAGGHPLGERRHRDRVGDVGHVPADVEAAGPQRALGLGHGGLVDVDELDHRAVLGEPRHDGLADARGAARHHRGHAVEQPPDGRKLVATPVQLRTGHRTIVAVTAPADPVRRRPGSATGS